MTISRHLTPKRRATLRADVRALLADTGGLLAPWRAYYRNARDHVQRAQRAASERARLSHLDGAATCLALAIAARKRAR